MDLVEKLEKAITDARMAKGPSFNAEDCVRSVLSCLEESGMVVVPREPSEQMLVTWENAEMEDGIHTDHDTCRFFWAAMLSGTPKP
jgi:hypothetical protein